MNRQNNFPKIPFFLSIIFFGISLFIFLFFYRAININNKESQSKELEWQTEMQRREAIKTLDNSVKMVEGDKAQLETHFAQSSDVVPFLDTIEGLAPQASVTSEITSVDMSADYTGLYVSMKASGTFSGLYKFLTLLENSPYELDFISLDMHQEMPVVAGNKNVKISQWDAVLKIELLSFGE